MHTFSDRQAAIFSMTPHLFAAMVVRDYAVCKDISLDEAMNELHPVNGRGGVAMATARNVRAMKQALKKYYAAHLESAMEY
jgi:hypothetical protein